MARKNDWEDDYEEVKKRSTLNLDEEGFATKKSPGKKKPAMSKAAMKGKDESMRKQALMAALRKKKSKLIPASPTK